MLGCSLLDQQSCWGEPGLDLCPSWEWVKGRREVGKALPCPLCPGCGDPMPCPGPRGGGCVRLVPTSPRSHEPHTRDLGGSGPGSFLPLVVLVGLEGSRQAWRQLPAGTGGAGAVRAVPCSSCSPFSRVSLTSASSCHPGLDIFLPESSSLFVNTLRLPSSSSSSQMWVGSCFQPALWAGAGTGSSSLCKDAQRGHPQLGTRGWQGWRVLGNQDVTGMQQELLGAIPGEWQSPGMQQEPPDVSMARGMWGWAAAQGGSLGAHTLLWHLRGVEESPAR